MAGQESAPERTGRRNPPVFVGHENRGPRNEASATATAWDHRNPLPAALPASFVDNSIPSAATGPNGRPRRRNFQAQIRAAHGPDITAMHEAIDADARVYYKPISKKTATNHEYARRLWLDYFTVVLDSEESAQATLAKGTKLPPLHVLQDLIKLCATTGRSLLGFEGVTGWSYDSTKKFTSMIFGMLHQQGVEDPTAEYREQITKAVETWAKSDKIITTKRKPKFTIREIDYIRVKGAIHDPSVVSGIKSHFQRSQHSCIHGCLFDLGSRSGQFVEEGPYVGTNLVLRWGDCDWTIESWDDSPIFNLFMRFHFMKGMKDDEGAITHVSLRSLPSRKAYYDTSLELVAMAIHLQIFEVDIEPWFLNPALRPRRYPCKLVVKSEFLERAVFTSEDHTRAMNYTTLQRVVHTLRDHFGWEGFTARTYRYSWCGAMAGRTNKAHMAYLLGHRYSSVLGRTTYQAPGRGVDVSALRHGEAEHTSHVNFHYSVAGTAQDIPVASLSERDLIMFQQDVLLQDALKAYVYAEEKVKDATGGRTSMDLLGDPELEGLIFGNVQRFVDAAQDKWSTVLLRYCALCYKERRGIDPDATFIPRDGSTRVAPMPKTNEPVVYYTIGRADTDGDEDVSMPAYLADGGQHSFALSHSLADVLHALHDSHPILPLVLSDVKNARSNVILHFLALYKQDGLAKQLVCTFCVDSADNKEKTFGEECALMRHMFSCESTYFSETHIRCNLCGFLVERLIPESRLKNPQTAADFGDSAVNEHFAQCYQAFAIETNNWRPFPASEGPNTWRTPKGPSGKFKPSSERAKIFSRQVVYRINSCTRKYTHWFCPLCLCDETLEWESRQQRFLSLAQVAQHIVSHGGNGGCFGPSKRGDLISYDMERKFICRIPACRSEDHEPEISLSLTEMIAHYHHVHHIPLMRCLRADCSCGGRNSCEDLSLIPDFIIFEDDLPILDDVRRLFPLIPTPDAVLVKTCRRSPNSIAQKKALRKFLAQQYAE